MRHRKTIFASAAALLLLLAPAGARAQDAQPTPAAQSTSPKVDPVLLASVGGARKSDPEAWHRLGIEYNRAGDPRAARAAFRKALDLRPRFVAARVGLAYTFYAEGDLGEAERQAHQAAVIDLRSKDFLAQNVYAAIHLERYRRRCLAAREQADAALAKPGAEPEWHILKARALMGMTIGHASLQPDLTFAPPPSDAERAANTEANRALLVEAAGQLEEYLRLRPTADEAKSLREQLDALRHHAGLVPAAEPLYTASEVSTKAAIRSKPEPGFTRRAREKNVQGIVRLRVALGADGKVRHVLVTKPLSDGLAEQCIAAARRIGFAPALKDGQPVTQVVSIEYNFNIY